MESERVNELSPVTLAYIGDAVFSLYVRTYVVNTAEYKAGTVTAKVNACVAAVAQSSMLETLLPSLSDAEYDVVRRARNCHTPQKAKNASLTQYKRATALEALFGWLYLRGDEERLEQLEKTCVESVIATAR